MDTLLRIRTGAPGDSIYTSSDIASVYDSVGIQEEFVEKPIPSRIRPLTPAEDPYQLPWEQNRLFDRGSIISAVDDDDMEDDDDDDDIDDEPEEVDVEEDVEDVADEDLDDDLDLDLDDDDDDDLL